MASLVLGAVGGYFFGPIGFAIGSALGSLLDPQGKSEGPRITDKRLQGSTYGEPIPIIYATERLAGQVIWAPDLVEHKHKSGGKGGPQVTTYTYTGSFDVLICDSNDDNIPVQYAQRIWADGTLIYDTTGATTVDNTLVPVTFYYGSESQLPDPTEEAVLGVGEVNAYRGYCRAVVSDWDLGAFGNRIPSLTFQVYTRGGAYPVQISVGTPWNAINYDQGRFEYIDGELIVTNNSSPGGGNIAKWEKYDINLNLLAGPVYTPGDAIVGRAINQNNWIGYDGGTAKFWEVFQPLTGESLQSSDVTVSYNAHPTNGNYCVVTGPNRAFWFYVNNTNSPAFLIKWGNGGNYDTSVALGAFNGSSCAVGNSDDPNVIYVAYNNPVGFGSGGGAELFAFDATAMTLLHHWDNVALSTTLLTQGTVSNFLVYKNQVVFSRLNGPGDARIALVDIDINTGAASDSPQGQHFTQGSMGRLAYLGNGLAANVDYGIFSLEPPAQPIILGEIIADISKRSGLETSQYPDLPGSLPDLVPGFSITRQSTGRDNIIQLRAAYPFDAVESSSAMKFVRRGNAPVVTIPDDDLAAQAGGRGTPPPLATVTRTPELDLPATMYVNYQNVGADYQTGTQYARRLVTQSRADARADLAIALTDTTARSIASMLLYASWLERNKIRILTSLKYSFYEPTDVLVAHGYTFRCEECNRITTGIVEFSGVATMYGANSVWHAASVGGGTDGNPTVTPPIVSASSLLMLDLPLITDTDYPNGPYAAMYPDDPAASFPGGTVYESSDGGSTYVQVGSDSSQDIVGTVATAVGDFGGGNIFDELNSVSVVLTNGGTLSSASRDAVINGANAFLLGSAANGFEVMQFRDALLTAPYTYTLTGLLRERRGTNWAIPTHGVNETFLFAPPTININGPFAELGAARLWKGVTTGATLSGVLPTTFTNNGVALKCYSPVHLGGGRDAAGVIVANWTRRTRIGGAWLNFTDVPLSEVSETYLINFYSASFAAIVGTLTVSAPTYTFGTVQQGVTYGGLVNPWYMGVQQIGSYGPGYETRAII